ncbi:PREDICTED: transmembrane protein 179B-like [Priapulus caudatus]|uniref:Transmembrane protein 179B-like n=1 Tax=Priapulus caudatus TaxID=37621 RepID=A0ABM1EVF2_PRICU|nr:PREDICTED: transmembrane protein 179B-like [Priapulus caudatus]
MEESPVRVEGLSVQRISSSWRVVQILLYVATLVGGAAVFLSLSTTTRDFNRECILYAEPLLEVSQLEENGSSLITVLLESKWGTFSVCNYCTYVSVASAIYAFIWSWFYLLCSNNKKKTRSMLAHPSSIVIPSLVFSVIFCLLMVLASYLLTKGFYVFCRNLKQATGVDECKTLQTYRWEGIEDGSSFYSLMFMAQVCGWLTAALWLIAAIVLFVRCGTATDFPYKTVAPPTGEGEPLAEGSSKAGASPSPPPGCQSPSDEEKESAPLVWPVTTKKRMLLL